MFFLGFYSISDAFFKNLRNFPGVGGNFLGKFSISYLH